MATQWNEDGNLPSSFQCVAITRACPCHPCVLGLPLAPSHAIDSRLSGRGPPSSASSRGTPTTALTAGGTVMSRGLACSARSSSNTSSGRKRVCLSELRCPCYIAGGDSVHQQRRARICLVKVPCQAAARRGAAVSPAPSQGECLVSCISAASSTRPGWGFAACIAARRALDS